GESRSPTAARTASRSGARNSSSPKRTARTPPPSSENATRPFPSPSAVGGVHDCRPSAYRVSMNAHLALSLWGENRRLTSERQEATVAEERLEQALFEIRKVIAGQDAMLERVLVCLLAQGHLLIEGVPGLAKTLTIKTTAAVLGGSFARIQFTPDLVPADL